MPITVLNRKNLPTGPFTREEVTAKLRNGEFALTDLAFVEGLSQWTPLSEVLARIDGTPAETPPLPPAASGYSYAVCMAPPPHLIYAGFWVRVAAHLIDNVIVTAAFLLVWIPCVMIFVGMGTFAQMVGWSDSHSQAVTVAFVGTMVLLYLSLLLGRFIAIWLYHAFLESGSLQATWGKRALGLKVTGITGDRISFGHASGRYFSSFITNMTMGLGYILVAFTERKQALHDMIAGTLVVRR